MASPRDDSVHECIEALDKLEHTDIVNTLRRTAQTMRTLQGRVEWLEERHETELFINGWWISRHAGFNNKDGIEIRVPGDKHPVLKQISSCIYLNDEHSDQLLYHFLDSLLTAHEQMIAAVKVQVVKAQAEKKK